MCPYSTNMSTVRPIVLVHGGAGDVPKSRYQEKLDGVKKAAKEGYQVLVTTGNLLDAVVKSINVMEDDEAFNAGRGSVLNLEGEVEMEALIMEGKDLKTGSVTLVKNVANPISLARMVLEKTPHAFLGGKGLDDFIKEMEIPVVTNDYLITQRAKDVLEKFIKEGCNTHVTETASNFPGEVKTTGEEGGSTVGAVALDCNGHLVSGTSTGGMNGKYRGRIGDTPLPGSGGYCDDNVGAVSTTGFGEAILRYNIAQRIIGQMESGKSAQEATTTVCEGMTKRLNRRAGAITLSKTGEVGVHTTTKSMSWAYQIGDEIHFGIEPGDHVIEKV